MQDQIVMQDLLDDIVKFSRDRDWEKFHTIQNLSKSISIEANELLELSQWGDCDDIESLSNELADVLIYCFTLSKKLNLDIEEIVRRKMELNSLKYPVEKSFGRSDKYEKL